MKKIMKADEDVRMISAEAHVIFARACQMFILELTLRSWNHMKENIRTTLQKNDIASAITRTDIFDFFLDIVPREDLKDEILALIPRGTMPVGGPADALPYYMPPQHPQVGTPYMILGKRSWTLLCMPNNLTHTWHIKCGFRFPNKSSHRMITKQLLIS